MIFGTTELSGNRRKERPFANLKIIFGPFYPNKRRRLWPQCELWHVVAAAGLSQQMIVSTPAAANTQPSNIPSESRNPRSKRTTFHITGTTFHEHKHFLKFTISIFIQPGRETNTSHQRKALDSNQEASVEPLCLVFQIENTQKSRIH